MIFVSKFRPRVTVALQLSDFALPELTTVAPENTPPTGRGGHKKPPAQGVVRAGREPPKIGH